MGVQAWIRNLVHRDALGRIDSVVLEALLLVL